MFSHVLRARSQPGHHIAIIEFAPAKIDKKYSMLNLIPAIPADRIASQTLWE